MNKDNPKLEVNGRFDLNIQIPEIHNPSAIALLETIQDPELKLRFKIALGYVELASEIIHLERSAIEKGNLYVKFLELIHKPLISKILQLGSLGQSEFMENKHFFDRLGYFDFRNNPKSEQVFRAVVMNFVGLIFNAGNKHNENAQNELTKLFSTLPETSKTQSQTKIFWHLIRNIALDPEENNANHKYIFDELTMLRYFEQVKANLG